MDKRSRQSLQRNEEVHRETPHPRSTKSRRKLDRIPSGLKGMHKRNFDGRKRKRSKTNILHFLAETQEEDEETDFPSQEEKGKNTGWKLYIDGASSSDGSGAGLNIVSPKGMEYTYALKFEFTTTNNEAEYEAVIAGLRIAREMKIEEITVFVDSQLVQYIRMNQNKKADALSKLASLTFEHLTKKVLVEKLANKSIYEKQVAEAATEEENN
ncbi:reverse transcriptase domain-containing protein [Tanacetum coccineum]